MFSGAKETVTELAKSFKDLYIEHIKNTEQLKEVRANTKETLDAFKHLLERLSDKLENSEKERIRTETQLLSKISALEARLNAQTEQYLVAVAKEVFEKQLSERFKNPEETKQLPS